MLPRLIPALCLILATLSAHGSDAGDFVEGKDYIPLERPQPSATGDKVEVIEFFSYGCPHCAHFEPVLEGWLKSGKPENVEFRRVPVAWNQGFEAFARVYYAAHMNGATAEADEAIFHLIHEEKPPQLTLETIADVLAKYGVDKEAFIQAFGGEAVTARVNDAKALTRAYRVTGVPMLVVDGRYQVPTQAGADFQRMLDTADYLAGKTAK